MIGSTSHAGMQEALDQMESSLSEINDDFGIVLPDDLDFEDNDKERSRIVKRIRAQYFGDDYVTLDGVELLSFCYTDASYLGPMIRAARPLVAAGAPVYFYEFSFVGDLNKEIVSSVKVHGATRGDVARYVFCHKGQVPDEGTKERQMVAVLTELWASFIHTGTPTAKSVEWHQLKQTTELNESWILIGSEIKPQKGLHLERLKLWTEIYETYFIRWCCEWSGMIKALVYTWLWLFVHARSPLSTRPHRDVVTTQGRVRGYLFPSPPHYAYLGVPYARPPTRYDRFKAPEPPPIWDGIFEAIHRMKCPQADEEGAEDCLVINVFAPEHATLLPVLVHVHDGGFQRGWGPYRAPSRLLKENFIIVTFNYRIGALGFLCLGTIEAPGNAGLKDQVAAFYWVQRNIKNFGGNPNDVTVYGTGSGAVAVELLLLSGSTTGLLHRVILESGSALAPTSVTYAPFATALEVASSLGYDGDATPDKIARFYQEVPARRLANATAVFLPCVERDLSSTTGLLEMDPLDIMKDAHFHHVPLMIAHTNAAQVKILTDNVQRFAVVPEDFRGLLPNNLECDDEDYKRKLADLVKEFYFGENEIGESLLPNYIDYVNDIFVEYPVVKSAILHARASPPVYLMKFAYKGSFSGAKEELIPGAGHGDIYMYIFTNEMIRPDEQLIAERLVTLLSNFIRMG
ncbi:unnamed protein product, partial [Iphiclides podalirius]